jgi:hypothetical protein
VPYWEDALLCRWEFCGPGDYQLRRLPSRHVPAHGQHLVGPVPAESRRGGRARLYWDVGAAAFGGACERAGCVYYGLEISVVVRERMGVHIRVRPRPDEICRRHRMFLQFRGAESGSRPRPHGWQRALHLDELRRPVHVPCVPFRQYVRRGRDDHSHPMRLRVLLTSRVDSLHAALSCRPVRGGRGLLLHSLCPRDVRVGGQYLVWVLPRGHLHRRAGPVCVHPVLPRLLRWGHWGFRVHTSHRRVDLRQWHRADRARDLCPPLQAR